VDARDKRGHDELRHFFGPEALFRMGACPALTRRWDRQWNGSLAQFAVIAIGASTGGVAALQQLVSTLPGDLPAAVLIVQHVGPRSLLPDLLNRAGPLPAVHAADGQLVRPGQIYVAPSDHHLLVGHGAMRLARGPRENWARPAVDPLFRSVAHTYGAGAIGVVLTGALNDGTAGLQAIRKAGGIAVVQHPGDALCQDMPRSALLHAGADHCVPLSHMGELLNTLAQEIAAETLPAHSKVIP
jgi:two-component system chemotaxis response regulator CheB